MSITKADTYRTFTDISGTTYTVLGESGTGFFYCEALDGRLHKYSPTGERIEYVNDGTTHAFVTGDPAHHFASFTDASDYEALIHTMSISLQLHHFLYRTHTHVSIEEFAKVAGVYPLTIKRALANEKLRPASDT